MSKYKNFKIAEQLYLDVFPKQERRTLSELDKILYKDCFEFIPIYDNQEFAGFANVWTFKDFLYLEHFAIVPEKRNKGLASEFLIGFLSQNTLPMVLEVEKPSQAKNDSERKISARRIAFYERIGFKVCKIPYFQPPYSPDLEGLYLYLMTNKEENLNLDCVIDTLYRQVYNYTPKQN